jgi:hypothetical protein
MPRIFFWDVYVIWQVDIELNRAHQGLEFVDSTAANQVSERDDDRVGFLRKSQQFLCFFNQFYGYVECCTHTNKVRLDVLKCQ